jgi:hypothetical protein
MSIFNILLFIGYNHTTNSPRSLPIDRVLDVLYEIIKIIENIIISLTYAGETTSRNIMK